jgi:hypothetical protein
MPFLGLGLHIIVAIFFAIHALRNGKQIYWLLILFSFPLLGSVVYFFAEYLPSSRVERGVKQVSSKAMQLLDPQRELREARNAFDLSATVQNRMRLAAALDEAGEYQEAVAQFDACLNGPFANDLEVIFGAAKAKFHVQATSAAIDLLLSLRAKEKDFRPEQISLLLAQCYATDNNQQLAKAEFVYAATIFGSAESRFQYAIWSAKTGDMQTAKELKLALDKDWMRWNKHSRSLHQDLYHALNQAISA